jgi:hypothetical protein
VIKVKGWPVAFLAFCVAASGTVRLPATFRGRNQRLHLTIRIEHEGAAVARPVLLAQTGRAIVAVAVLGQHLPGTPRRARAKAPRARGAGVA